MPTTPKLMFQICQKLSRALFIWNCSSCALPGVDVYVFQHHLTINRKRIHQRTRYVRDVNESRFCGGSRSGVLNIDKSRTEIENTNVRSRLAHVIPQCLGIAKETKL